MSTSVHQPEERPENAGEKSAPAQEQVQILLDIRLTPLDLAESHVHGFKHNKVQRCDCEQKPAEMPVANAVLTCLAWSIRLIRLAGRRDHGCCNGDNGRMAEREEEAGADRPLTLSHEFAGDIVYGGDVIGIHAVTQSESVSENASAQQQRLIGKQRQRP